MISVGVALFGLVDLMVTFKLAAGAGALLTVDAVPLAVVGIAGGLAFALDVGFGFGFAAAAGVGVGVVGTDVGMGMTNGCVGGMMMGLLLIWHRDACN